MTTTSQMEEHRKVEEIISVLEARIFNLQRNPLEYDEVFPASARALYFHLLGRAYLDQFHLNHRKAYATFTTKCLKVIHDGVKMAINHLEPADCTRLLCIHTYCRILMEIAQSLSKAKIVAERSFEEAVSCDNVLDDKATAILQKLRDDFMTLDPETFHKSTDPDYRHSEGYEDGMDEIHDLFGPKGVGTSQRGKPSADLIEANAIASNPALSAKIAIVRKIRRGINVIRPVILETLPSSSAMMKALDQIFRAYIRGNALPGQLVGGNAVDFAGHTITFRAFVLDGPYLSWKGFLSFLLDFQVARAPNISTKPGKHFLKSLSSAMREAFIAAASNVQEPLLSMVEAATLFIEASGSTVPALSMRKSLRVYEDMAKSNATASHDSWSTIFAWAEDLSEQEWNIPCGLNFMQFIDCLGKLGIIGYSSAYFQEMLPSVPEKVEHFLSAYLGLADKRRWQGKVDAKLQAVKTAIARLADPQEKGDKEKGHKEKGDTAQRRVRAQSLS